LAGRGVLLCPYFYFWFHFIVVGDTYVVLAVTVMPGPVAVFCMVYHYTIRAMLTRLLGNVDPAIYVVL